MSHIPKLTPPMNQDPLISSSHHKDITAIRIIERNFALLKESTDQGVLLFLCAHTPTESVSVRRKYKNKNMILAKVTRSRFTGCPLAFAVLHLFDFWKGKEEDRKKVNISSIEPGSLECRNPMAILSLLCTRRRLRS